MKISKARKANVRRARMALSLVLKKRNGRKATAGVVIAIPSSTHILCGFNDLFNYEMIRMYQ